MEQDSNNIMIVGENAHFLYLMQRYVRRSAYKIIAGNPGDDLLALARCKRPVAVVLAVDAPETMGWRILRELKSDPEVSSIPVIACSWLDDQDLALAEGADMHLRMPILYADFKAALESIPVKKHVEKNP